MSEQERVTTGDEALDRLLCGGLLRGSATLLTGPPGAGKSVLAQQIAFANATRDEPVLHISTFTEPQAKVVRNLRAFAFFDERRLGDEVVLLGLSDALEEADPLQAFVDEVVDEVLRRRPAITIIDSIRAASQISDAKDVRRALYQLVAQLGHTGTTLVLVGEYPEAESDRPEYAVTDSILWLQSTPEGPVDRRSVRIVKHRGSTHLRGRHSVEIAEPGLVVHPRLESTVVPADGVVGPGRDGTGVPGLDEHLGGGLPKGAATLVMGASGTGKTLLASQFLSAGAELGETALFVALEESRDAILARWRSLGMAAADAVDDGRIELLERPIVELDIDKFARTVRERIEELSPDRIVFDSLGQLVASARRNDRHPGYVWALSNMARATGASVLFTHEVPIVDALTAEAGVSDLFGNTLLLRHIEEGQTLGRALTVLKMRDSTHTHRLVRLRIGDEGMRADGTVENLEGGLLGWSVLRSD